MAEKGSNSDTDSNGNDTASTLVNGDSEQFPLDTLLEKMPKSPTSPRQIRRLSVPDMHRLKRAVEQRESIGDAEIPYGKLQVCLFYFFIQSAFWSLMQFNSGWLVEYAYGCSCEKTCDALTGRSTALLFTSKQETNWWLEWRLCLCHFLSFAVIWHPRGNVKRGPSICIFSSALIPPNGSLTYTISLESGVITKPDMLQRQNSRFQSWMVDQICF